jgi:hypothetical protein
MVGVAGLAVLGMTATLAGGQTDEVKEKPTSGPSYGPSNWASNCGRRRFRRSQTGNGVFK